MNYKSLLCCLLMSCNLVAAFPQSVDSMDWDQALETLLSDEDMSDYAREELTFLYESIHESPFNINTATLDELIQLPFLTYEQIEDIHAYVYLHGSMLTLGELQLVGSLDWSARQLLKHFVYAGNPPVKRGKLHLDDVLRYGKSEIVTRMDIPLYKRDGFRYHSPEELARYPNRAYLGNNLSHSIRYSFNWKGRIRFGLTADKDAGEPFGGENRMGYDFYSSYLFLKDFGVLKELAVGKYKAQFGLGLLMGGGFSIGKSMSLSSMGRSAQGLKPHSSTQEYGYLEGVGSALGFGHTTVTVFAASTPIDATLKGDTVISSFKEDGYHRTGLEFSKKHNSELMTLGANLRYSYRGLSFGTTLLTEKLSMEYKGRDRFGGMSVDGSLNRSRYSLAWELSLSEGRTAILASQTFRLPDSWSLNTVFRSYSTEYMSLHSNALSEGGVGNETGLLAGLSHTARKLKISGYVDLFMHPEPKYGASEPSNGMDVRLETEWRVGYRDNLYFTGRIKSKQKDCKYTGQLEYCITDRMRLRWTHSCRGGAEFKTQLAYTRYDFIAEPIANGWGLTQSYNQILFNDRLSLNLTVSAFCTDSYDCSVSVYESGLRYSYNFITMYGQGLRGAATVQCKLPKGMQLNLKASCLYYLDRDEISSSQQRIDSCHKEDISVQFIARFQAKNNFGK